MKTIELTYPHSYHSEEATRIVAAIGFFDGIHKGHQAVIQEAIDEARQQNKKSAVITFSPHPSVVLSNSVSDVRYITPRNEKERILRKMGVDYLFIIQFTKALSKLSPDEFLYHYVYRLNIDYLIGGFDFTFGKKGVATIQNLHQYDYAPEETKIIEKVTKDGEKVSSTRIRSLLKEGYVDEVASLLGRPLAIETTVIHGEKRGRTLGYPTANLSLNEQNALLPKQGVYAVTANIEGESFQGIANLGYNPTFQYKEDALKLEVYLLDFDRIIYGETVRIQFYKHLRGEKKFASIDDLIKQLQEDEHSARNYFRESEFTT